MSNYVAIVFDNDNKAYEALHALWRLNDTDEVTVHGAAVVHRDRDGHIDVAVKNSDVGSRTAIGVAVGALLGALAGPIGVAAAGAGAAAAAGAGIGAAAGGLAGVTGDAFKADEQEQAGLEARFVLPRGKSALIAEISEDTPGPIDALAVRFGGIIYRRPKSAINNDQWDFDYSDYLYEYDYAPLYA